jgi:hypothetical protein
VLEEDGDRVVGRDANEGVGDDLLGRGRRFFREGAANGTRQTKADD